MNTQFLAYIERYLKLFISKVESKQRQFVTTDIDFVALTETHPSFFSNFNLDNVAPPEIHT